MMKKLVAFLILSFPFSAQAKDVALILNDQEQQTFYQALDAAVRANGIQVAPNMLHLLQRLQAAPVVTENKPDAKPESAPPKTEPKKDDRP